MNRGRNACALCDCVFCACALSLSFIRSLPATTTLQDQDIRKLGHANTDDDVVELGFSFSIATKVLKNTLGADLLQTRAKAQPKPAAESTCSQAQGLEILFQAKVCVQPEAKLSVSPIAKVRNHRQSPGA
jgi:hypothetical protein